ncbi:kinase-like domain-containing protein [Roridomyces roridus]|uniref:Kinase-like domain-containing protein n=1 Tax=Roridomyces roridus TaxID=1738132 RepID=A0AAD7CLE5_9AGAR|nr:kinase-like domain-containing protein [Roridomyces roridus]
MSFPAHPGPGSSNIRRDSTIYFIELGRYLADYLADATRNPRSESRQKLTRLTIQQCYELSTDVYDELRRREHDTELPRFLLRADFHPKRNQARQKLASFPKSRFQDLCSDVHHELARRYPKFHDDASSDESDGDFHGGDRSRENSGQDREPDDRLIGAETSDELRQRRHSFCAMTASDDCDTSGRTRRSSPWVKPVTKVEATTQEDGSFEPVTWIIEALGIEDVPTSALPDDTSTLPDSPQLPVGLDGAHGPGGEERDGVNSASDAGSTLPFSQYLVEARLGGADRGQPLSPTSDSETDNWANRNEVVWPTTDYAADNEHRDATIRELVRQLDRLFHDDEKWYMSFLDSRDASAQWLLDLLQDLLDYDADIPLADRRRIFKALIRLSDYSKLYPRCFTLTDLEQERLVDGGSFSDVYQGYLHGQCVAVKMMRVFDQSDIEAVLKCFGREAIIWRQLSHPNLLPFYGLYKFHQRLCLVSPWMENGHIRGFLKNQSCDTNRLLSMILDMARGLEHLHAKGIVHGDLKGDNIFVTPSLRACIADFGLSSITTSMSSFRFTLSSKATRGGTVRYQAPELHDGGHNDLRSDIYGFACVVYELLTGNAPFPEMSSDGAVIMAVIKGRRPPRPPSCSGSPSLDGLWALLQDCWHGTPEHRPTAAQVVQRLIGDQIGATETGIGKDWDDSFTSKFRRQLLEQQPLPSVREFERMVFGDDARLILGAECLDAPETWPDTNSSIIREREATVNGFILEDKFVLEKTKSAELPRVRGGDGIPEAHITAFLQGIDDFVAATRAKTPLNLFASLTAIVNAVSSIIDDVRAFSEHPLRGARLDALTALPCDEHGISVRWGAPCHNSRSG